MDFGTINLSYNYIKIEIKKAGNLGVSSPIPLLNEGDEVKDTIRKENKLCA